MITLEEAVKRADELKANSGVINEYSNCYIFARSEEDFGSPLVIEKETGQDWNLPSWLGSDEGQKKAYIKSHKLVEGKWEEYIDPIFTEEE